MSVVTSDRAGINAYSNGYSFVLCKAYNLFKLVPFLHVAGVDTDLIYTLLNGFNGEIMSKMYIRN